MYSRIVDGLFHLILVLFVIGMVAFFVDECQETAFAQESQVTRFSEDVEALARLRVNEAGWPSTRHPTNDGGMIGQYVMKRAERAGESIARYIARVHHRHTSATSSRPWIRGLNREMQMPPFWPEGSIPWMPRGHAAWFSALQEAESVILGEFAPCSEVPDTWGGTVDRERIARILANGGRVVSCGNTLNTPLKFR